MLHLLRKSLLLFLCSLSLGAAAQIDYKDAFPDIGSHRGGLIVVDEMHDVRSNPVVYLSILRALHQQLPAGDTINLLLEIPYSRSVMFNTYCHHPEKRAALRPLLAKGYPALSLFDSLCALGIPVHCFGGDFEYDQRYRRNESFAYLLEQLAQDMRAEGKPSASLEAYIAAVKAFERDSRSTDKLYAELEGGMSALSPALQSETRQVLYALEAKQQLTSGRDKEIYNRALAGIARHYFKPEGRINVMIHGTAHVDPVQGSNVFNRFRNDKDSPFRGKCVVLGNVYLACKTMSGIFQHESTQSMAFYVSVKNNKEIVARSESLGLKDKELCFVSPARFAGVAFPDLKPEELIGLYIHNKVTE
jgi:hypothetical protein